MKNISRFTKKNLLIVLFGLFICIGVGLSAYVGSDEAGVQKDWSITSTHVPSTPTPTLVANTGWWRTVTTPTTQPTP